MRKFLNTLSGRVIATLIIGIAVASIAIILMLIKVSEDIFIDTYGQSQEKVFLRVEDNFTERYEGITKAMEKISNCWSFNSYFSSDYEAGSLETKDEFEVLYRLHGDIENVVGANIYNQHLMIVGTNGRSYVTRDDIRLYSTGEILDDRVSQVARENPDRVNYVLRDGGFTRGTEDGKVMIAVKAFTDSSGEPFAYVYITFSQQELAEMYDFFCTANSSFYMVNDDNTIMVSDKEEKIGSRFDEEWQDDSEDDAVRKTYAKGVNNFTILSLNLKYSNFSIYGIIDNKKALNELYNVKAVVLICIGIIGIVALVTSLIIKKSIAPLRDLSDNMSQVTRGNFDIYMPVEGTEEIQVLAKSYNYMLDDLKIYVDALVTTQKSKRKAEIKALQMQINPHYVYNTLASIKWLIWQREVDKSTRTIDAFIALLRNTISNTDEFITVGQERENVKNYMWINGIRYGERIKTDFFVVPDCENYLIPKMILQPFVENSFFHGFPNEETGSIQIFVRPKDDMLQIEIRDDGVGMSAEKLKTAKDRKGYENYSGIGISNISERLKLIYGDEQSLEILSQPGQGTTVRICMPAKLDMATE